MARMRNGMPADELGLVAWRKSGRSNSTGNCVEFACVGGWVAVRDDGAPRWIGWVRLILAPLFGGPSG
jgi:hypothetical protein